MNQVYDWKAWRKLYVGKSGSGKTTLFWEHFNKEKARIKFLYDHKAMEFCLRYKCKPVFEPQGLMDRVSQVIERERGGIVAFVPSKMFPGEPEAGFEFFCEFVFAISETFKGRKLIGIDEVHRLVGTASKPKPLLTICDIGRTYQMDCFFMASACNTIHNLVLHQMTEIYAFMQGTKNACDFLEEKGFNREALLSLKRGEYHWCDDTGQTATGGKAF